MINQWMLIKDTVVSTTAETSLKQIPQFVWTVLGALVIAVVSAAVTALVQKWVSGRGYLVAYFSHAIEYPVKISGGTMNTIRTHGIILEHKGTQPVNNIRITHKNLPENYNLQPSIPYTVETLPDGQQDIVISKMTKGQQVRIDYIYFPPLLMAEVNNGVRSDEGFPRQVEMELSEKTGLGVWIIVAIMTICTLLELIRFFWWCVVQSGLA